MNTEKKKHCFVLCVDNSEYPASLEERKVYETLLDPQAESYGQIRVIDESGDDYLYPRRLFIPIQLPEAVEKTFAHAL
ncbi:MAG: hypothetical protein ABIL68_15280 [bacterium]